MERIPQNNIGSLQPNRPPNKQITKPTGNDFQQLLNRKMTEAESVTFSKHAKSRIDSRDINLDEGRMELLKGAIDKAKAKGAKESLVLLDDTAFVVSVDDKTVITAADTKQLKDDVFTNIDSAVIIK